MQEEMAKHMLVLLGKLMVEQQQRILMLQQQVWELFNRLQANTTAGFSIVTYTGTGSTGT